LKPVVPTFQGRPESEDLNLNLRVSNWTRFRSAMMLSIYVARYRWAA
jgi:hypothetical protein